MKLVYFTHSLRSCWNHGNAHFLRGVLRALQHAGQQVAAYEPAFGWSAANLLRDHGRAGFDAFRDAYPDLQSTLFDEAIDLQAALDGAEAVVVHEWNEPWLIAALGRLRRQGARFTLLFHDTHHRAVSDPGAMQALDLDGYDGVLAFGAALAQVYRGWGWGDRVFVWHEAADVTLFKPPVEHGRQDGVVWIGNWGDGERSRELETFLLRPTRHAGLSLDVYGVRYPPAARAALDAHGARYRGWLPNARSPDVFARHAATVHVPRRFYVDLLQGIPTIRVFEALACGIPLVSAPWRDVEGLFQPGDDFLVAASGADVMRHLRALHNDRGMAAALAARGLKTVQARHTCGHRAAELLDILNRLRAPAAREVA